MCSVLFSLFWQHSSTMCRWSIFLQTRSNLESAAKQNTKAQTVRFQCQNDHKRNVDHFLCSWLCLYLFSPVVLLCKYRSTAAWFLETSFDHMQVRHRPNWKALRHRSQGANDVLTVTNKIFGLHFLQTVMTSFACNTHDDAQVHAHDLLSSAR